MGRRTFVCVLVAAAAVLVGCGGAGAGIAARAQTATLALVGGSGGVLHLTANDPLSLTSLPGPRLAIGEYHDTFSFSPDGARLAIGVCAPGTGPRIGLQIVDVASRSVLGSVETGIAAEAVAWVAARRIVALLQSGEVVVLDAASGAIVDRPRVRRARRLPPERLDRDRRGAGRDPDSPHRGPAVVAADAEPVWQLQIAAGRAFARGLHRTFVLDPASGRVLAQPRLTGRQIVDLLG